jgi:hypothetical protein
MMKRNLVLIAVAGLSASFACGCAAETNADEQTPTASEEPQANPAAEPKEAKSKIGEVESAIVIGTAPINVGYGYGWGVPGAGGFSSGHTSMTSTGSMTGTAVVH